MRRLPSKKKILLNNTVYYIFLSVIFLRHTAYGFPHNKHSKLSHISTINPIINTLTQTWTHGESQTTFEHFNKKKTINNGGDDGEEKNYWCFSFFLIIIIGSYFWFLCSNFYFLWFFFFTWN